MAISIFLRRRGALQIELAWSRFAASKICMRVSDVSSSFVDKESWYAAMAVLRAVPVLPKVVDHGFVTGILGTANCLLERIKSEARSIKFCAWKTPSRKVWVSCEERFCSMVIRRATVFAEEWSSVRRFLYLSVCLLYSRLMSGFGCGALLELGPSRAFLSKLSLPSLWSDQLML